MDGNQKIMMLDNLRALLKKKIFTIPSCDNRFSLYKNANPSVNLPQPGQTADLSDKSLINQAATVFLLDRSGSIYRTEEPDKSGGYSFFIGP